MDTSMDDDIIVTELEAFGVIGELAAAAARHRVMVSITFSPYEPPDGD